MFILELLCGLVLFLFGMDLMGDALKKSAGSSLKTILGKMTSNPFKGFLLGLGVTAIIQSSSATTVMVVGFVSSGTMTLLQATGVIMGANVGTAVTAWLTALSGLNSASASGVVEALSWLKPSAWLPVVAVLGFLLYMFSKRGRRKDIGVVLIGFVILMTGMDIMGDSVGDLGEQLSVLFTIFGDIPVLGVLAGLVLTAVVQSSSASVGILQSLTLAGGITFGAAIPIVMGQNIGTCVTALISAFSANRDGKRAAMIHLYFNIIGVVVVLSAFYAINAIFHSFDGLIATAIEPFGVALVHTVFKIISVLIMFPFYRQLEKLACISIPDSKDEREEKTAMLDERLLSTPTVAVERATQVTYEMASISFDAFYKAVGLFDGEFNPRLAEEIRALEDRADKYEDAIGSYLVKISACDLSEHDSEQITKLLHLIGDLERVSDHAVNVLESKEEMTEKKLAFSAEAQRELSVMRAAVSEILTLSYDALVNNDLKKASDVEPLEEVVDDLRDRIKLNHVLRLQKSECTIEHGFVLSDLLNNFERVADHCSNIAGCVIEISKFDALDMHKYLDDIRQNGEEFDQKFELYKKKYQI
ncbi:MAG: Na/Pi cotransporter family protein [Ruminococcaceae bacterium]|nr:Na/Pi cotransporter family protein [Oscillospiraceae bacterium]